MTDQHQRVPLDYLQQKLQESRARQDQLAAKLQAIRAGRVYHVVKSMGGWKWLDLDSDADLASGPIAASGNGVPPHFWFDQCEQLWRRIGALEAERESMREEQASLQERVSRLTTQLQELATRGGHLEHVRTEDDRFEAAFARIREPKQRGMPILSVAAEERLLNTFAELGIPVKEFRVDVHAYRAYFEAAGYLENYPAYYPFNLPEKSLEHYIAATLLQLQADDIYIDIASEHSPVPDIYKQLFGTTAFRQDLAYEPGLNGDRIGGDAAAMPVPDAFASKVALHCSFEHFEGDSDSRFVMELGRVLKPGGAACFVPLYVAEQYAILTDPEIAVDTGVEFEEGVHVFAARGWNNRHGRFYDPQHVVCRLVSKLGPLVPELHRIVGAEQVDPTCYARFALVLRAPLTS